MTKIKTSWTTGCPQLQLAHLVKIFDRKKLHNFTLCMKSIHFWRICKQHLMFFTRMHSSRMRTARSLTVSPSMLCSRGGCLVPGSAWSQGGVCSGGVPGPEGVPAWSGGGGGMPACTEADSPCEQNYWHTLVKILPCPKLCNKSSF